MSLIMMENVSKSYLKGTSETVAVKNVSLEIEKGEIVYLIGRSGSGKSTLLTLVAGLEYPSAGKIMYDKTNFSDLTRDELIELRKENIGFVFQHFHLINSLTSIENILLPISIRRKVTQEDYQNALSLLEKVGLDKFRDHYPPQLSGGQKQLVGILRAIMAGARLIIADEPTGDLDADTGERIFEELVKLARESGTTLIIATHDLTLLREKYRVLFLHNGEIIANYMYEGDLNKIHSLYEYES